MNKIPPGINFIKHVLTSHALPYVELLPFEVLGMEALTVEVKTFWQVGHFASELQLTNHSLRHVS
jgi:hypothetical protein